MSSSLADSVIRSAIVWDNHSCMPLRPDDEFLPQLERCRRAGQTVVSLNAGFDLTNLENNIRVLAQFEIGYVATPISTCSSTAWPTLRKPSAVAGWACSSISREPVLYATRSA